MRWMMPVFTSRALSLLTPGRASCCRSADSTPQSKQRPADADESVADGFEYVMPIVIMLGSVDNSTFIIEV
jgi:hypothetical protein